MHCNEIVIEMVMEAWKHVANDERILNGYFDYDVNTGKLRLSLSLSFLSTIKSHAISKRQLRQANDC